MVTINEKKIVIQVTPFQGEGDVEPVVSMCIFEFYFIKRKNNCLILPEFMIPFS